MAKLTLAPLASLANQSSAIATINANSDLIELALENTLSRDGTTPNTMGASLDMDSNRILNLPEPIGQTEPARLAEIQPVLDELADLQAAVDAAEQSAIAAAVAESNAELAEANAEIAEANAETAETNAEAAQAAAEFAASQALLNSENPAMGYNFDTATADADPGPGDLRFNNATVASVTAIYIDNVDRNGATQTGYIDTWDDSTSTLNKGYLTVRSVTSGASAVFRVTGTVVDGTGYRKLTVANLSNGGTFGSGDTVAVMFSRSGDAGSGDVTGPASATDNALPRFDSTTGKIIKASGVIVDNSNNVTGVAALTASGLITAGTVDLGGNTDTTLSRLGAGNLGVEGVSVALNSTGQAHTASQYEVGAASDTTISRSAAGIIAVEGVALYSGTPVDFKSAAYPIVLADAGRMIGHASGDNNPRTFTIPANGSIPFPIGTCISFVNLINVVTIAITSDTLLWAGPNTTGSRALAAGGMATAVKVAGTQWVISGVGLS